MIWRVDILPDRAMQFSGVSSLFSVWPVVWRRDEQEVSEWKQNEQQILTRDTQYEFLSHDTDNH